LTPLPSYLRAPTVVSPCPSRCPTVRPRRPIKPLRTATSSSELSAAVSAPGRPYLSSRARLLDSMARSKIQDWKMRDQTARQEKRQLRMPSGHDDGLSFFSAVLFGQSSFLLHFRSSAISVCTTMIPVQCVTS